MNILEIKYKQETGCDVSMIQYYNEAGELENEFPDEFYLEWVAQKAEIYVNDNSKKPIK